jgi:hypothetical protein
MTNFYNNQYHNMTPQPRVFVPNAATKPSLVSQIFGYILGVVLLIALLMRATSTPNAIIPISALIIIFILVAFLVKKPVSITISTADKTLLYSYKDFLGKEHEITVDLSNAGGGYKYELFSKVSSGWRLLIYNGNYFHNRVSIEQREGGFSKEQLDEIVELIHECRNLPA